MGDDLKKSESIIHKKAKCESLNITGFLLSTPRTGLDLS